MEIPSEAIDIFNDLCARAKADSQRFKAEAEAAAKAARFWDALQFFLVHDWTLHFIALVDREEQRITKMKEENHPAITAIDAAYLGAMEKRNTIFRRFPSQLADGFAGSKLALDPTSRHPKYTLESGFFELEIDERLGKARLKDYEGKLAEIPADVQAVVKLVEKEYDRIFARQYKGTEFLRFLRKQYKAVISNAKQADGSSVPIRKLTHRLGKNLKGFRTDEFLVDLSRLAREGPFEIDGRRLDLQQTKDTNQGMLLHGAASRGYVGFIVFKEV